MTVTASSADVAGSSSSPRLLLVTMITTAKWQWESTAANYNIWWCTHSVSQSQQELWYENTCAGM